MAGQADGLATTARKPATRRLEYSPYLLVLPLLVLFVIFYAIPIITLLLDAFYTYDGRIGILRILTLENFVKFLSDRFYLGTLLLSLRLGLLVTAISLAVGYPVAYYIHLARGRQRAYLTLAVLSPLLVSVVIRSFGWILVLYSSGVLNAVLKAMHLPPTKLMYTEAAVVIGLVHVYLPFMILSVWSSLQNVDPNLRRAAMNLGASPLRAFLQITLPLSLPGILAGSLIVFALTVSSFVTPAILGGSSVKMVAYIAYEQSLFVFNWPFAAAVSLILLLATTGVFVIYNRIIKRGRFAIVFQ